MRGNRSTRSGAIKLPTRPPPGRFSFPAGSQRNAFVRVTPKSDHACPSGGSRSSLAGVFPCDAAALTVSGDHNAPRQRNGQQSP